MTAADLRRRYVVLSALRFLPTGLLLPVTAIYMGSKGLSLADIGLVAASQAVVVLVLELPTGGLADAIGRRSVLVFATALDLAAMALLLAADTRAAFVAAFVLQGIYRALESGPLDAWYVDAALDADEHADIERGLAASSTALSLAIAAGGLGAAGLTELGGVGGLEPLALPILFAIGMRGLDFVALLGLVTEPRPRPDLAGLRAGVSGAGDVVRAAVRLVATTPALLALVVIELLWGAGLIGVELLSGPRLAELLGDAEGGVTAFGFAVAGGWLLSALGSAAAARLTARLGSPAAAGALLRLCQGAATLVMAVVGGAAGLVTGYLAFYLVHGPSNVVHYGMVHRLTTSEHRATMVSANSLTSRLGGFVAALVLGAVASGLGIPFAWLLAAALLAGAAPLYRIAGRGHPSAASAGVTEGPRAANEGMRAGTPG